MCVHRSYVISLICEYRIRGCGEPKFCKALSPVALAEIRQFTHAQHINMLQQNREEVLLKTCWLFYSLIAICLTTLNVFRLHSERYEIVG
jgi:hypothetical protein